MLLLLPEFSFTQKSVLLLQYRMGILLTPLTKRIKETLLSYQLTFTVLVQNERSGLVQKPQISLTSEREIRNQALTAPLCVSHLVWV